MTLVDGGVGRETIDVVVSFGVPDGGSRGAGKDDGERMVVVGCVGVFVMDGGGGGGGMVFGFGDAGYGGEGGGGGFECATGTVGGRQGVCVGSHV